MLFTKIISTWIEELSVKSRIIGDMGIKKYHVYEPEVRESFSNKIQDVNTIKNKGDILLYENAFYNN